MVEVLFEINHNDIFPTGGLVYIIDLENGHYKLGSTADLKQRLKIYETGTIHKKKVVFWFESEDMETIERCVKAILMKNAIKKKKEVYLVELKNIIHAIKGCSRILYNVKCEICDIQSRISNIEQHFDEYHSNMMNKYVIFENAIYGKSGDEQENTYYHKYLKYKRKYMCSKN